MAIGVIGGTNGETINARHELVAILLNADENTTVFIDGTRSPGVLYSGLSVGTG